MFKKIANKIKNFNQKAGDFVEDKIRQSYFYQELQNKTPEELYEHYLNVLTNESVFEYQMALKFVLEEREITIEQMLGLKREAVVVDFVEVTDFKMDPQVV